MSEELGRTNPDFLGRWAKVTDDEGEIGLFIRRDRGMLCGMLIQTSNDAYALANAFADAARVLKEQGR